VGGILENRFYIGELPDGKGGWVKGKHAPIVPPELFEAAQQARGRRSTVPQGTRSDAHRYSLSGVAHCAACGSHLRVFAGKRMLCNERIDRNGCSQPSARLAVLDSQMSAYLQALKVPEDYREKMLACCGEMDTEMGAVTEAKSIKGELERIKRLYRLGDMGYAEYLADRQELQARLARLTVRQSTPDHVGRMARFLTDMALAWEAADQEQKNRLASELFEKVWLKDGIIQGVTPRPDMVPFFDLVYSEAVNNRLQVRPRRGSDSQVPQLIP
jgi:hypothetical protein